MSENRYERRERKLKERTASLPEIPEDFYEWSKKEITGNHYLFYRRAGNKVTVWCSACGQVDEYKLRAGETLDAILQTFRLTYEELQKLNEDISPAYAEGTVLNIPSNRILRRRQEAQ